MASLDDLFNIDDTGVHVADYEDFLTYHQDAFKTIYGQDINLDADSQDGQLCAHFAQAHYDVALKCAKTFNNYSPLTASGEALSRQVKINGIRRRGATKSTVDLVITGDAGTGIRNGKVQDQNSNNWSLPSLVTIPVNGTITVTATADEDGEIRASPNTVNKIATPIAGWISVTNPAEATPGIEIETDAALRVRQTLSTAQPSQSLIIGMQGVLQQLDGVTRVKVYENDTSEEDENGIPGHTICAVVEGGDSNEIAENIRIKKGMGCGTYGSTAITVTDSKAMPITIRFFRPTTIHIKVKITLQPLAGYSSTYANEIQQEVSNYINGLGIGSTVYLSKMFVPANLVASDHDNAYDIEEILMGQDDGALSAANIKTAFNAVPYCEPSYVEVHANGS